MLAIMNKRAKARAGLIAAALLLAGCGAHPNCLSAAEKSRRIADTRDQLAQAEANEATVLGFSRLGTRNGRRRIEDATKLRENAARNLQAVEREMARPVPGCS